MEKNNTFQWKENVQSGLFFKMPRNIINSGLWADLPKASKSIYLPLLRFVNKHGWAWPSNRTLAIYSGSTEKTARIGRKGLEGLPGLKMSIKFDRGGHSTYRYEIEEPQSDSDHSIIFSHAYFDGGNWSQLSQVGQAVFPVLKFFTGWWDYRKYCELECLEFDGSEVKNIFKDRDYDFMDAEAKAICLFAGISRKSLPDAFNSLVEHGLIEFTETEDEEKLWKVHTKPIFCYPRDLMNKETKERYG